MTNQEFFETSFIVFFHSMIYRILIKNNQFSQLTNTVIMLLCKPHDAYSLFIMLLQKYSRVLSCLFRIQRFSKFLNAPLAYSKSSS